MRAGKTPFLEETINAYMTIYLTLTMTVLLSLCLTLVEGVRSNAIKLESDIVTDIAVNSVMAEYSRELLRRYNLFAIDDSYGTDSATLENTRQHLLGYLDGNFRTEDIFLSSFLYRDYLGLSVGDAEIDGVLYMTDERGKVFRRRAYEAIKDDVNLSALPELKDWLSTFESGNLLGTDLDSVMKEKQKQVDEAREKSAKKKEEESKEVTEVSTEKRAYLPKTSPLSLITYIKDVSKLSKNAIDTTLMVSKRNRDNQINVGNLSIEDISIAEDLVERFAFQEYLIRYMGRYGNEKEDTALKYQLEYLIGGKDSDVGNLQVIAGLIHSARFVADYAYVRKDEQKCDEAELLATVIATFTYTEELKDTYKELLLLMWGFTEAQNDVRRILSGEKVVLTKSKDTWKTNILEIGTMSPGDDKGDDEGLTYLDYLRVFLMVENQDLLNFRAMDIVESDVRQCEGNEKFRMDACIDTLQFSISTYSTFGYTNKFSIRRKYE